MRWLVAGDMFARALDVEDERVAFARYVQERVASVACAAPVEAVEAYVKTSRVVLGSA